MAGQAIQIVCDEEANPKRARMWTVEGREIVEPRYSSPLGKNECGTAMEGMARVGDIQAPGLRATDAYVRYADPGGGRFAQEDKGDASWPWHQGLPKGVLVPRWCPRCLSKMQ
jgi:hypothetical protein